jgi:hypothetical protein
LPHILLRRVSFLLYSDLRFHPYHKKLHTFIKERCFGCLVSISLLSSHFQFSSSWSLMKMLHCSYFVPIDPSISNYRH